MSERLQLLLSDSEISDIQRAAKRERLTVNEWARRVLRAASVSQPATDAETKLRAVRRGAKYAFPTADIERMLGEIEQGYLI